MEMNEVSKWAYILFVLIAIIGGLAVGYMAWSETNVSDINGWFTLIMLILGVIIGLTSVTRKEVTPFLIATIALMVAGAGVGSGGVWYPLASISGLLYEWATYILSYIVAFAAPAAVLIAVKAIFSMAKD